MSDLLTDRPRSTDAPQPERPPEANPRLLRRLPRAGHSLLAHAEPMLWLTGGGLAISLFMIVILLLVVLANGLVTFWPVPVERFEMADGQTYMGEVTRSEWYEPSNSVVERLPEEHAAQAAALLAEQDGLAFRQLVRTGNFELTSTHFHWVEDFAITRADQPEWALVVERLEWGRFYGLPKAFLIDDEVVAEQPEQVWTQYLQHRGAVLDRRERRRDLEEHDIGRANFRMENARLEMRQAMLDYGEGSPEHQQATEHYEQVAEQVNAEYQRIQKQIEALQNENNRFALLMQTAQGQEKAIPLDQVVRAYPANQLGLAGKVRLYVSRWIEFLWEDPREANSEGGVYPAIFGTVVMTLIMSIAVVPFGVLAALYLREYAKAGPIISAVRIAINNLAGVPSIVFGVFGLGFFCYIIGGWVDGGPVHAFGFALSPLQWVVGLVIGAGWIAASVGVLYGASRLEKDGVNWWACLSILIVGACMLLSGVFATGFVLMLVPGFNGLFEAKLPSPTFGTGGILWASLTLALLTLPVVIVATEEALAAVPSSMRQGSYACGASKWQTIRRIVLPRAMPGIMTGMILAMARGAGEVAPLMLVGAVKLAPELPVDGLFPYVHPERSFMHLGFHIYDLGFQSQNSEAAKPMVFTTTLLLILIIAALNLAAIWLRGRLRRRFITSQF